MSDADGAGNDGYDQWIEAVSEGRGYYLECPEGHASLPPREVCPECASGPLSHRLLSEMGTIESAATTHVPTPGFADDAPYTVAIAAFGPVRLTGQLRSADERATAPSDAVGTPVQVTIVERTTTDEPLVAFEPV